MAKTNKEIDTNQQSARRTTRLRNKCNIKQKCNNNEIKITKKTRKSSIQQIAKRKPLYFTNITPVDKPRQLRSSKCNINLRTRNENLIYKETSDETSEKTNPLSVFEFNTSECESSSTDDEDNSMRIVLRKLKENYKKKPIRILEAVKVKSNKNKIQQEQEKKYGVTILSQNTNETKQVKKKVNIKKTSTTTPKKIDHKTDTQLETQLPENIEEKKKKKVDSPVISSPKIRNKAQRKFYEIPPEDELVTVNEEPEIIAKKVVESSKNRKNNNEDKTVDDEPDVSNIAINDISPIDKSILAKNLVEDLTKSFIEDDDTTPKKIQILSNIVLCKPGSKDIIKNIPKPAKPWRVNVPCFKKRPYIFTYKDKSFTPRYEPDFDYKLDNNNKVELKDNKKPVYQTSIANFLNGEKPKIIENNELFNDPQKLIKSPRKALVEINFVQSTPIKPSRMNISHDISIIKSSPKRYREKNKENLYQQIKSPTNKKQTQEINLSQEVNLKDITVPLFQEIVEEDLVVSKKFSKKYEKKYPKRKRLPSVNVNVEDCDTDSEVDVVNIPEKKRKCHRTKEEDLEADRLASKYNSMFEEIEKHELIID